MSENRNAMPKWTTDKELENKVRNLLLSKINYYKENYSKVEIEKLFFITLERSKIKSEHYTHVIEDVITKYESI